MKKLISIIFVAIFISLLHACYNDKEQLLTPPKTTTGSGGTTATCANYSFANDVFPIISANCAASGCHGAGSSNGPGELIDYAEVQATASQIQASIQAGRMPLGKSLTAAQITTITCWISNGELNN